MNNSLWKFGFTPSGGSRAAEDRSTSNSQEEDVGVLLCVQAPAGGKRDQSSLQSQQSPIRTRARSKTPSPYRAAISRETRTRTWTRDTGWKLLLACPLMPHTVLEDSVQAVGQRGAGQRAPRAHPNRKCSSCLLPFSTSKKTPGGFWVPSVH